MILDTKFKELLGIKQLIYVGLDYKDFVFDETCFWGF
jgi:hypothetical protein